MKFLDRIYDVWRKRFGTYTIDDPRPVAASAPYTFYLPSDARLNALEPGDLVKLTFRGSPPSKVYDAERMWVEIEAIDGENLMGRLDNDPFDMPQLKPDAHIEFKRWQVIDTEWADERKEATIPSEPRKQRWERCMVDDLILSGESRVYFLYREQPDLTEDDDKYPDSGWRLRVDVDKLTSEECENLKASYVALGAVLNKDDRWIHLIDEPPGKAWYLNSDTGEYEPTES